MLLLVLGVSRNPLFLVLWNEAKIFNLERNINQHAILLGSIGTCSEHFAYVACSGMQAFGIWGHLGDQHLTNMLHFPKRRRQSKKTGHPGQLRGCFPDNFDAI